MALAYYNEIDPYAAQWLRNLVAAGHIAAGDVDERSIEDVKPSELVGYTQCHFFAGIGVWSHALRQAGWPDDKPVWTGSCPCQPFSAAGKGGGFDDERHLWPAFHHLIEQCKPATVIGEQVASKDANAWIDLVHADLEAVGYAFGAVPFPSASVGAPHIRDRLYWVADSDNGKRSQLSDRLGQGHKSGSTDGSASGGVGYPLRTRRQGSFDFSSAQQSEQFESRHESVSCGLADSEQHHRGSQAAPADHGQPQADGPTDWAGGRGGVSGGLADTNSHRCGSWQRDDQAARHGDTVTATSSNDRHHPAGPTNGFWRDADWLLCRDGKWRPVEPGTFPLAHGATSRVGRLRAYGNAINAKAAQVFIGAYLES